MRAVPLTIANHSFEDTVVPDGFYTVNSVPGWLGEGSWFHVANPTDAQFTGTTDSGPGGSLVDGHNVAAINNYGHLLYQSLTATVLPDYTYTLTVLFGHRNNVPIDSSANLVAGDRFLTRGFANPPEGSFTEMTIVYHSPSIGDIIGQPLKIELRSAGDISQGWFDNVRLDAAPSDPGTLATLDTAYIPIPPDHPDFAPTHGEPRDGFTAFSDNGPLTPANTVSVRDSGTGLEWFGIVALTFAALLFWARPSRRYALP